MFHVVYYLLVLYLHFYLIYCSECSYFKVTCVR